MLKLYVPPISQRDEVALAAAAASMTASTSMIFICVKWTVKPEYADQWVELTRDFTEATRAEDGNLFFEWSRSVEDPNQYVLIEAFRDDAAEAHVGSAHFKQAQAELPQYVVETPHIRNMQIEGDHWDRLGEFEVASS